MNTLISGMNFINPSIKDLKQFAKEKNVEYVNAEPYPNIVIDGLFDEDILNKIVDEFPDLAKQKDIIVYNNLNEVKLAAKGEGSFGETTRLFAHYLNSQPFLEFLQELTGIKEMLVPDPYFIGGGYHEIKPGGLLKVHTDFNKHDFTMLDRRVNVLVYLNKDWDESYGGHFEMWDYEMKNSVKKILPIFNRMAVFSTTDFANHGHPNPLTCPPDRSRRSLALYYYSNGRPKSEVNSRPHATIFKSRADVKNDTIKEPVTFKDVMHEVVPPFIIKAAKKIIK